MFLIGKSLSFSILANGSFGPKSTEQRKADNRCVRAIVSITPSMMVTAMYKPVPLDYTWLTPPRRSKLKTATSTWQSISDHYTRGGLRKAIHQGLTILGKAVDSVIVDDLAPVDEFHIGGRQASEDFLDQLDLNPDIHILDVGCGLGGTARFVASRYGARVTGIDLTGEYIETTQTLCQWVESMIVSSFSKVMRWRGASRAPFLMAPTRYM